MPLRVATLILMLLALVVTGCGGDDEDAGTPKAPELTVPETDPETTTDETETQGTATEAPSGSEGQGGGTQAPPNTQPDSPSNDIPPEPGTPEDRFEQFCKENPGACG